MDQALAIDRRLIQAIHGGDHLLDDPGDLLPKGGQAARRIIDLLGAETVKLIVELVGDPAQRILLHRLIQGQHLLFDRAAHEHQHQQHQRIAHIDKLQMLEQALARARGCGQRRLVGGVRQHGHRQTHPLIEL